jgi:hypothetical protein
VTLVAISGAWSSDLTITDTEYHHVAVTRSGNSVVFYVDGDGDLDLLLQFKVQDTGIVCGTTSRLTGRTVGGLPIEGSDSVTTVGCNEAAIPAARPQEAPAGEAGAFPGRASAPGLEVGHSARRDARVLCIDSGPGARGPRRDPA